MLYTFHNQQGRRKGRRRYVLQLTTLENTMTYHNVLCSSLPNFAQALFSVSLGAILTHKRNWRQCLCKIWGWQAKSIMVCNQVKVRAGSVVSRGLLQTIDDIRIPWRPWDERLHSMIARLKRGTFWQKHKHWLVAAESLQNDRNHI